MSIKLIIFDLDGTLVDSSVDITNALNYSIEPYAFRKLTVADTITMIGEGVTKLIGKLVGEADEALRADVTRRFLSHYSEHVLDYTRVYPGVRETLEELSGYRKAVISNKRESLSRAVLEGLGLDGYFDAVLGSDSAPEKKPSPMPIRKVMAVLEIPADETMMVGDSSFDIDSGKSAGVTTVAVTYGYRPKETLFKADYMIDRISDLPPLLRRIDSAGSRITGKETA